MEPASPGASWVFILLLVLGAALYATHFDNSFQFDDFHSIVENPSIRGFGAWRSWFTDLTTFSVLPENLNYRPLLLATYALSYTISGLDVWGFHLINWALHVGVSFLVYLIGLRLFSIPGVYPGRLEPRLGLYPPSASGMALLAALLFLVHPLNSEPVNYISSRSESLATFFVLLAFLLHVKGVQRGDGGEARTVGFRLGSAVAYACGLLTKEIAITFPALVVLYDWILAPKGERRRSRAIAYYVAIGAMTVVYLVLRERLITDPVAAARSGVGRATYFFTQIRAWLHYLREFLWPARLSADTDFGWSTGLHDPRVQLALLLIAGLALGVARAFRRHALLAFGAIWALIALLPTSSFFPLAEPVNDHRPYLAGVGLSLALVSLLFSIASRPGRLGDLGRQGVLCAVLGAAGTLLVLGTLERNRVWDSPRSLWSDVVAKSPGNGRAHMNLGLALMEKGDFAPAGREFDLAVERSPRYALAYVNRAILRRARGDSLSAMADIDHALRLSPESIFVLYWAGKINADAGNLARAVTHLEKARQVSPRHVETLRLLLDLDARSGRPERLPGHLAALDSLGLATDDDRRRVAYQLLVAGRNSDAVPILELLVRRQPEDLRARFNLGFAYLGLGRHPEAERELKFLLAHDPKNAQAWQNLLWIYKTTGDRAAYTQTEAEMTAALGKEEPTAALAPAARGRFIAKLPAVIEVPMGSQAATRSDSGSMGRPTDTKSNPAGALPPH